MARQIDDNFLNLYNQSKQEKARLKKEGKKHRLDIDLKNKLPTVVMSQWYRDALGGFDTTTGEKNRGPVKLKIEPYGGGLQSIFGPLFAASQHPDISVRLGTRLGVLGTWLGLIGISPIFLELLTDNVCLKAMLTTIIALSSAGFGVWACWPLSPPPLKQYDQ